MVGLRGGAAYPFNVKAEDYNGEPHITFFAGSFSNGDLDFGRNVILDQSYKFADTVVSGHGRASGDAHPFNALPGGTAMISILQLQAYDLTQLGVNQTYGWVLDRLLQETGLKTQKVLFEWSTFDHVSLEDSNFKINQNPFTGDGEGPVTAYDYFHLNSAAKAPSGNYLVSSRHASAIYLISAYDGSALWRLSDKNSTFDLENFTLSCQHDLILRAWTADNLTIQP